MLAKLSLRNAKRQIKDYLIYFTTIIIAATLIYAFNALVFSKEIRNLSNLLDMLPLMIGIASAAVVAIIGWLVYYVMRFMMVRRSRELGTYILLGIERKHILRMFFLENMLIGAAGVLLGLLSGNLLFQILRAVLLQIYEIKYSFSFHFSLKAALLALVYFSAIFLVALLLNRRKIRKSKIGELIQLDRYNEREIAFKSKKRKWLFAASLISGVFGVGLLITYDSTLSLIGAALIVFFLFAFYISFSSGVPAFFDRHPGRKYAGNNLYVFRLLCSKIGSMGITMSIISILLTATLIAIGTGLAFNHLFIRNAELETEHNLFISTYDIEAGFDDYKSYIDENIDVISEYEYAIYRLDNDSLTQYITPYRDNFRAFDYDTVMAYSDYAALRRMLGYDEVLPQEGEYILQCLDYLIEPFEEYNKPVRIGTALLSKGEVRNETFTQQLWDGNGGGFIIIVADEIARSLPVSHIAYAAKTGESVDYTNDAHALNEIRMSRQTGGGQIGYDMIYSKDITREQDTSLYVMIVLPLFYVALVLLIVASTILAVQMLSGLAGFRRQYGILHNLGAERNYLLSSLRKQFMVYYLLPTFPAVIISAVFIFFLCTAFDPGIMQSSAQIWTIVGTTIGMFFAVFSIYIGVSYVSLRRSIGVDG